MIQAMIHALAQFVLAHAHWAPLLLALVAFSEALVVVGTLVPGSATLVAVGAAAGALHLPLLPLLLGAMSGAVAGDTLSFFLGRHYGPRLLSSPRLDKRRVWIVRGEKALSRWGDLAVFGGRLLPPTRALIPAMAGTSVLPWWRFLIADVFAALVWAALHLGAAAFVTHALVHGGWFNTWWHAHGL
ncbi:hypothetical protein B1806_06695 [Metallibacterium scheffleri]|uniref:VTT domain-containing protein n=2 Tax=Metallibacterium scheffleri TaxID=993689 RepID=A0A4S3KP91_9GAMM|nr:hypothetical protein B1806_06695 [Metallibacterium scheffleri]